MRHVITTVIMVTEFYYNGTHLSDYPLSYSLQSCSCECVSYTDAPAHTEPNNFIYKVMITVMIRNDNNHRGADIITHYLFVFFCSFV